jgi:hypothetical protein
LLLAGIEMVFWGLTEALQTAFYAIDPQLTKRISREQTTTFQEAGDAWIFP